MGAENGAENGAEDGAMSTAFRRSSSIRTMLVVRINRKVIRIGNRSGIGLKSCCWLVFREFAGTGSSCSAEIWLLRSMCPRNAASPWTEIALYIR